MKCTKKKFTKVISLNYCKEKVAIIWFCSSSVRRVTKMLLLDPLEPPPCIKRRGSKLNIGSKHILRNHGRGDGGSRLTWLHWLCPQGVGCKHQNDYVLHDYFCTNKFSKLLGISPPIMSWIWPIMIKKCLIYAAP